MVTLLPVGFTDVASGPTVLPSTLGYTLGQLVRRSEATVVIGCLLGAGARVLNTASEVVLDVLTTNVCLAAAVRGFAVTFTVDGFGEPLVMRCAVVGIAVVAASVFRQELKVVLYVVAEGVVYVVSGGTLFVANACVGSGVGRLVVRATVAEGLSALAHIVVRKSEDNDVACAVDDGEDDE